MYEGDIGLYTVPVSWTPADPFEKRERRLSIEGTALEQLGDHGRGHGASQLFQRPALAPVRPGENIG